MKWTLVDLTSQKPNADELITLTDALHRLEIKL